jgi:hypothetical protein
MLCILAVRYTKLPALGTETERDRLSVAPIRILTLIILSCDRATTNEIWVGNGLH